MKFSISLPIDVADLLDDYCEQHKLKRSHVVAKALAEMQAKESSKEELDVPTLRAAILRVSRRYDWSHQVDTTDRTEEIAEEYMKERIR